MAVKKPESNEACIVFDTGFTGRAYTKEGVMGQFGIGYQYRLYKTFDNSCTGSLENRVVNRIEKRKKQVFITMMNIPVVAPFIHISCAKGEHVYTALI